MAADLLRLRERALLSRTETWSQQEIEDLFNVGRATAQMLMKANGQIQTVGSAHSLLDAMIAAPNAEEEHRIRLAKAEPAPKRKALRVSLPGDLRHAMRKTGRASTFTGGLRMVVLGTHHEMEFCSYLAANRPRSLVPITYPKWNKKIRTDNASKQAAHLCVTYVVTQPKATFFIYVVLRPFDWTYSAGFERSPECQDCDEDGARQSGAQGKSKVEPLLNPDCPEKPPKERRYKLRIAVKALLSVRSNRSSGCDSPTVLYGAGGKAGCSSCAAVLIL